MVSKVKRRGWWFLAPGHITRTMSAINHVAVVEFRDSWHAASCLEVAGRVFAVVTLAVAPAAKLLMVPAWAAVFTVSRDSPMLSALLSFASVVSMIACVIVATIVFLTSRDAAGRAALLATTTGCNAIAAIVVFGLLKALTESLSIVATPNLPTALEPVLGVATVVVVAVFRIPLLQSEFSSSKRPCFDPVLLFACVFVIGGAVLRVGAVGWAIPEVDVQQPAVWAGLAACVGLAIYVADATFFVNRFSLPRAPFALGGYQHRLNEREDRRHSGRCAFPSVVLVLLASGLVVDTAATIVFVPLRHGLSSSRSSSAPASGSRHGGYDTFASGWRCMLGLDPQCTGDAQYDHVAYAAAYSLANVAGTAALLVTVRFSPMFAAVLLQLASPLASVIRMALPPDRTPRGWVQENDERLGFVLGNVACVIVALMACGYSELRARGEAGVLERQIDDCSSERSPFQRRHQVYEHHL